MPNSAHETSPFRINELQHTRHASNSFMSHENYVIQTPQSISHKGRVYLRISALSLHSTIQLEAGVRWC